LPTSFGQIIKLKIISWNKAIWKIPTNYCSFKPSFAKALIVWEFDCVLMQ
jgi:hypothetical protein